MQSFRHLLVWQRAHALAPVWEVNHIWLILAIVIFGVSLELSFSDFGRLLRAPRPVIGYMQPISTKPLLSCAGAGAARRSAEARQGGCRRAAARSLRRARGGRRPRRGAGARLSAALEGDADPGESIHGGGALAVQQTGGAAEEPDTDRADETTDQVEVRRNVVLSAVERPVTSAKFDLTLQLQETAGGLEGQLVFASDVFDASTMTLSVTR